jgi:hypothetical protein
MIERQALGNLGNAYRHLEDFARAIAFKQQSLTIAQDLADRRGELAALSNL